MDASTATTSAPRTAVRVDDGPEAAPGRETSMKAIVLDRYGPPEVLEHREIDQPTPRDNQVLGKVLDTAYRAGLGRVDGTARGTGGSSIWR